MRHSFKDPEIFDMIGLSIAMPRQILRSRRLIQPIAVLIRGKARNFVARTRRSSMLKS